VIAILYHLGLFSSVDAIASPNVCFSRHGPEQIAPAAEMRAAQPMPDAQVARSD
jgi:hypothetical protein